ncbi:unnamed protein product, partial [Staurois parvus]
MTLTFASQCSCVPMVRVISRGGLTTHGAPGNRGSWGPCVLGRQSRICEMTRGGLTIWKLGHCPRARGQ